jgi:hypothetical protein
MTQNCIVSYTNNIMVWLIIYQVSIETQHSGTLLFEVMIIVLNYFFLDLKKSIQVTHCNFGFFAIGQKVSFTFGNHK